MLAPDLGQAILEFGDGLFPLIEGGSLILKEGTKDFDEVVRLGNVEIERALAILHEHGAMRRLEEDVVARVAELEFCADLLVEIVARVFGLPQAVDEAEAVEQRAIRRDLRAGFGLERIFRDELPLVGAAFVNERGAIFEQRLKGGADGALVGHAELLELVE